MLKKGDRVQENNNIGTVTAIHTKGTVDVLFDGEEYAIRRQDYDVTHFQENPMRSNRGNLKLIKPKKKSKKKVKKLTKRMRAKLPKSDFVFPSKRSFPIPDIGHGRLALQYAQWPNNKKNLSKIKKAVFKRYPSLISWWNKNHPKDRWTKSTSTRRKMVANPRGNRWKMKEGTKTGRRVWVVTGRVNKGPKVFYTKKNASAYLSRRKKEK